MQAWLSQYAQGLGALSLTQEVRSTSCEAVAWHGTTRKEDEPLRNRSADSPPCTIKVGFTKRPGKVFPGRRMQINPRLHDPERGRISLCLD